MEIRRAEASSVQKGNLRADGQAVGRGRSKWEDGAEPRYACAVAWEPGGGGVISSPLLPGGAGY